MILRTLTIFILGLSILGCQVTDKKNESPELSKTQLLEPNYKIAIQFINDYLDFSNDLKTETRLIDWFTKRNDLTAEFKNELKRIIKEAEKNDAEIGLGFDPILNAQDNPNQFEFDKSDSKYIVVKGVNWPDFKLTLKLKLEENKWLVDGACIVNIPLNKRIER